MHWILIVFVSQAGNPQLIMTQPPKFVEGMENCLVQAAQINRDFDNPAVGACIPAFDNPNQGDPT